MRLAGWRKCCGDVSKKAADLGQQGRLGRSACCGSVVLQFVGQVATTALGTRVYLPPITAGPGTIFPKRTEPPTLCAPPTIGPLMPSPRTKLLFPWFPLLEFTGVLQGVLLLETKRTLPHRRVVLPCVMVWNIVVEEIKWNYDRFGGNACALFEIPFLEPT